MWFAFKSYGISSFLLLICFSCQKKEEPFNIIFIMSDDHASQAIGTYQSRLTELNPTPTLDVFAKDALVLENCFCCNSISTPSRASILTGQYSHHNGVKTLEDTLFIDQQYLPLEMRKLGYETAIIGKWHLKEEPAMFDYYSILSGGQGRYFNPEFHTNEHAIPWPNNKVSYEGHSSDIITDLTLDWLKNKRNKDKPFFIMHHFKAPHDNFDFAPRYSDYLEKEIIPLPEDLYNREMFGSEAIKGKNDSLIHVIGTSVSRRHIVRNYVDLYGVKTNNCEQDTYNAYQNYLKRYLRCVKGIDDNLNRLFKYLKEEGLWDNTIIIYTSDQGLMLGEHDLQDKRWMYEESLRMPFIIRVPKANVNGQRSELLVNNVDFAPTLIELAGGKSPDYMDGKSFAPILSGDSISNWRSSVYYRYWMHLSHHDVPAHFGIRTKNYKLIFYYGLHFDSDRYGEKSIPWVENSNLIRPTPASFELYDLRKDPNELNNVANDRSYKDIFDLLKKQLFNLKEEVGDYDMDRPEIQKIIDENFYNLNK